MLTEYEAFSGYVNNNCIHMIVNPSLFTSMSAEFDLDVGFLFSTFLLETGNGTSQLWLEHNNPAGIKSVDGSGRYQSYETQEDGLRAMYELIKHYTDKGINSVDDIRSVWSESEDTEKILEIWRMIICQ